ncbi:glycosyltransferase family 4 protein [Natronolimnohabitans innermongolicus]|uniref:Hexosyltransferase n=1 Tax=Natronolimnohabitans innermongolicus JCM 12255 TaxID=1227499 RepID=L9XHP6_9EURY|nr:glycosyltransferase family 4 protein [Natronolimnohabitans innermongolicus]ELY61122.1 hexosyltransferase [Natronolimnohabitans innermongolicus JCM 12255]
MTEDFTVTIVANKVNKSQGGSNFSLDLIARTLVERGHEVNVVTLNLSSDNDPFPDREYDVYERSVSKQSLLTARPIVDVFDEWESTSDVYHVFSPLIAPYAGKYRRDGGSTPVLCRLNQYSMFCSNVSEMDGECHKNCSVIDRLQHSSDDLTTRALKSPLFVMQSNVFSKWGNCVDKYYAVSPRVKEIYSEYGIDGDRITVIPNFYNPDFMDDEPSIDTSNNQLRVLYVGRLSAEKGIDSLIESLSYVDSPVILDVVGEGDEKERLEEITKRVSGDSTVQFHGFVENHELRDYYDSADIFVHPASWPEPFSRTILEGMQSGCALIVTDTGGSAWAIGDVGKVVPPRSASEIGNAINAYMNNPKALERAKHKSRKRCQEFNPDDVIDRMRRTKSELVEAAMKTS